MIKWSKAQINFDISNNPKPNLQTAVLQSSNIRFRKFCQRLSTGDAIRPETSIDFFTEFTEGFYKRARAATICGNWTLTLHSILMWHDKQIEAEKYESKEITQALAIALCDKKIYIFIQFCTLITAWSFGTNSLYEPLAGIPLSCYPFLTFP